MGFLGGCLACDLIWGLMTGETSLRLERWWNFDWRQMLYPETPHGSSSSQSSVYVKQHLCLCADGAAAVISHAEKPAAAWDQGRALSLCSRGGTPTRETDIWEGGVERLSKICDSLACENCFLFPKQHFWEKGNFLNVRSFLFCICILHWNTMWQR